jgi:hypothetical protein
MKNPTMLYKHPGQHKIHGDSFDYVIVDESEVEAKLKEGWAKGTEEAKAGKPEKAPAKRKTTRKRARNEEGEFKADNPATPDVNEAFEE